MPATSSSAHEALRREFAIFGESVRRRAPLYATLSQLVADDDSNNLIALLDSAPPTQRRPVLLFAAIHDLVLEHSSSDLARHYPSVGTPTANADDLAGDAAAFCAEHADAIRDIVAHRHTQTNDISRSAILRLACAVKHHHSPLHLIDIGCSGGLNLYFDEYFATYHAEDGSWSSSAGLPGAPQLSCGVRSNIPVDLEVGTVVNRVGFDPKPIDIFDDTASRWLRACIWPDQLDRLERLDEAITWARRRDHSVQTADALAALDEVELVPPDAHPLIVNSWVLSYLTAEDRVAYRNRIDDIGRSRDLTWIYLEQPSTTAELEHPVNIAATARDDITSVTRIDWLSGARTVQHLGVMHPHGYWFHPRL